MKRTLIQLFMSVTIGLFFFFWIFQNVDVYEVVKLPIRFRFILLGFIFYSLALYIRAIRWHKLLCFFEPIKRAQVLKALVVGYSMNIILPARLGELFRAHLCKQWFSLSRAAALATIVWERVADGVTVVACLMIGFLSVSGHPDEIFRLIFTGSLIFFGALFMLFFLRTHFVASIFQNWPKVLSFQKGVQVVPVTILVWTLAISLLVWTFDGLALWAIVRAADISMNLPQSALLVGVVSLSTLLPSPPGFLGTLQFAFGMALVAAGHSAAHGILAATLTQIFLLGPLAVIGILLLGWAFLQTAKRKSRSLTNNGN